jgi:hypothetical protein
MNGGDDETRTRDLCRDSQIWPRYGISQTSFQNNYRLADQPEGGQTTQYKRVGTNLKDEPITSGLSVIEGQEART